MHKRSLTLLITIAAVMPWLAIPAAQADETLDKIQQRHTISVGVMVSGLPFGSLDPKTGAPIGYNVELAQGVAKGLGVDVELVPVLAPSRVQFLQQGKVDILIANMNLTPERAKMLDYVPTPYEEIAAAALMRKNSGIKRWEDLRGKPVCVSQGSNFITWLRGTYGADIKAFRSQAESLLSLRGNGCVAAVHVSPTMLALLNKPEWADYEIPLEPDREPLKSVIWLRKGSPDAQAKIDAIVRDWHRSGWLIDVGERNDLPPSAGLRALHETLKNAPPSPVK